MVAAGIPSKNSLLWKIGGAALVLAVLAATGGVLKINFEREPAQQQQAAKLTAGANITSAVGAARDDIPAPQEVGEAKGAAPAAAIEAHDLPAAPHVTSAALTKPSFASVTPVSAPPSPPAIDAPPPPAPKAASKSVDKYEVF